MNFRLSKYLVPVVIIASFTACYSLIFDSKLDLNGDNATYYILGHSIASGNGYTNVHLTSASPANHYPPGYPVIIAAVMKLVNAKFTTIKIVNGLFLLLSLLILYFLIIEAGLKKELAAIITFYVLLNKHLLLSSTIMMSEIPFLMFSLLAIFMMMKSDLSKPIFKDLHFLASVMLVVICVYIRTVGIALVGGIGLSLLVNKSYKHSIVLFGGVVLGYFPWIVRGQNLGGNSYINSLAYKNIYQPELGFMSFGDWLSRFGTNLHRYVGVEIPNGLLPMKTYNWQNIEWTGVALGIFLIALMILGLINLKRFGRFFGFYLAGNFGILLLWPEVWVGTRFMQPIIPIILIGVFAGFTFLLDKAKRKERVLKLWHAFAFLGLFILVMHTPIKELRVRAKGQYNTAFMNYFELASWVSRNSENSAIVACRKPELFYLYSGRKVTRYKYTPDDIELIKDLDLKNVEYVIIDNLGYSSTGRYLVPAVQKNSERFEIVMHLQNPDTYLLRLRKPLGIGN